MHDAPSVDGILLKPRYVAYLKPILPESLMFFTAGGARDSQGAQSFLPQHFPWLFMVKFSHRSTRMAFVFPGLRPSLITENHRPAGWITI
jgi:hypothetical protein